MVLLNKVSDSDPHCIQIAIIKTRRLKITWEQKVSCYFVNFVPRVNPEVCQRLFESVENSDFNIVGPEKRKLWGSKYQIQ